MLRTMATTTAAANPVALTRRDNSPPPPSKCRRTRQQPSTANNPSASAALPANSRDYVGTKTSRSKQLPLHQQQLRASASSPLPAASTKPVVMSGAFVPGGPELSLTFASRVLTESRKSCPESTANRSDHDAASLGWRQGAPSVEHFSPTHWYRSRSMACATQSSHNVTTAASHGTFSASCSEPVNSTPPPLEAEGVAPSIAGIKNDADLPIYINRRVCPAPSLPHDIARDENATGSASRRDELSANGGGNRLNGCEHMRADYNSSGADTAEVLYKGFHRGATVGALSLAVAKENYRVEADEPRVGTGPHRFTEEKAVNTIIRFWKRRQERFSQDFDSLVSILFQVHNYAAQTIQRRWRGILARKFVREELNSKQIWYRDPSFDTRSDDTLKSKQITVSGGFSVPPWGSSVKMTYCRFRRMFKASVDFPDGVYPCKFNVDGAMLTCPSLYPTVLDSLGRENSAVPVIFNPRRTWWFTRFPEHYG